MEHNMSLIPLVDLIHIPEPHTLASSHCWVTRHAHHCLPFKVANAWRRRIFQLPHTTIQYSRLHTGLGVFVFYHALSSLGLSSVASMVS